MVARTPDHTGGTLHEKIQGLSTKTRKRAGRLQRGMCKYCRGCGTKQRTENTKMTRIGLVDEGVKEKISRGTRARSMEGQENCTETSKLHDNRGRKSRTARSKVPTGGGPSLRAWRITRMAAMKDNGGILSVKVDRTNERGCSIGTWYGCVILCIRRLSKDNPQ